MKTNHNSFKPTFNNLTFAKNVFIEIDKLSTDCISWESTSYKNSTARLYELLAAVYKMYEDKFVSAKADDRRTLRQQLEAKFNELGITVRKKGDTLGLLIRYIFKADRRRLITYKNAILAAKSKNVNSDALPQWLSDAGGVEEVSKSILRSDEAVRWKEEVIKATDRVQELIAQGTVTPLGTVNLPDSANNADVMLLAKHCGNGQFNISYVFENPTEGVKNNLIRQAATKFVTEQTEINVAAKEAKSFINFASLNKAVDLAVA